MVGMHMQRSRAGGDGHARVGSEVVGRAGYGRVITIPVEGCTHPDRRAWHTRCSWEYNAVGEWGVAVAGGTSVPHATHRSGLDHSMRRFQIKLTLPNNTVVATRTTMPLRTPVLSISVPHTGSKPRLN